MKAHRKDKRKDGKQDAKSAKGQPPEGAAPEPGGKLKVKDYERELAKLHVELVGLQEWVVQEKRKICVVFRGTRRGRQGWYDQGDCRAGKSAGLSRRGAPRPDRA